MTEAVVSSHEVDQRHVIFDSGIIIIFAMIVIYMGF